MPRNHRSGPRLVIVACAVLLAVSISPLVGVVRADLPPRPANRFRRRQGVSRRTDRAAGHVQPWLALGSGSPAGSVDGG